MEIYISTVCGTVSNSHGRRLVAGRSGRLQLETAKRWTKPWPPLRREWNEMGDMDGLHAHTLRPSSPYGSAGVAHLFPSSAVSLLTRLL